MQKIMKLIDELFENKYAQPLLFILIVLPVVFTVQNIQEAENSFKERRLAVFKEISNKNIYSIDITEFVNDFRRDKDLIEFARYNGYVVQVDYETTDNNNRYLLVKTNPTSITLIDEN